MLAAPAPRWARPHFCATTQSTKILFVAFGREPLEDVPFSRADFSVVNDALLDRVQIRQHRRADAEAWFSGWWGGAFGKFASADLGENLERLTASDVCVSIRIDLPDQPDLTPIQTAWSLVRWLCARGADVVLDVYALRFRTREGTEALNLLGPDVRRDIKLTLENQPTEGGLHLLHTRGLCKFARPELLCFVEPDDAALLGGALENMALQMMEGSAPEQLNYELIPGFALVTRSGDDGALLESLGLDAGVRVTRTDGQAPAGVTRARST